MLKTLWECRFRKRRRLASSDGQQKTQWPFGDNGHISPEQEGGTASRSMASLTALTAASSKLPSVTWPRMEAAQGPGLLAQSEFRPALACPDGGIALPYSPSERRHSAHPSLIGRGERPVQAGTPARRAATRPCFCLTSVRVSCRYRVSAASTSSSEWLSVTPC